MNLAELIRMLVEEEGLTSEEAAKVAAATLRAGRNSLAKPQQGFPSSPQQDRRGVDYGSETQAEAKERWIRQEMSDPSGLFSGGATAGGVFGDGSISTENFDPGAVSRSLNLQAQLGALRTQQEMLILMRELSANRQLPPQQAPPPREFPGFTSSRILGRKKR